MDLRGIINCNTYVVPSIIIENAKKHAVPFIYALIKELVIGNKWVDYPTNFYETVSRHFGRMLSWNLSKVSLL